MNAPLFIGREKAIDEIITRMKVHTQSTAVIADSGMGKTALLRHISRAETLARYGVAPEHFKALYFACPELEENSAYSPKEFWLAIFDQLQAEAQRPDLTPHIEAFRRLPSFDYYAVEEVFFEARRLQLHVVLLLDDFDNLLAHAAFGRDFLWSLKNLANNNVDYYFGLVTATLTKLSQLCHDPAVLSSPFFNIFSNVQLEPFTALETGQLLTAALGQKQIAGGLSTETANRLHRMSAGVPLIADALVAWCGRAGSLQALLTAKRPLDFDEASKARLARLVRRVWKNSDEAERALLNFLAASLRANGYRGLTPEQEKLVLQQYHGAWQALEKRGLMHQADSVLFLFADLFAKEVLT